MVSFESDYIAGAHPEIIKRLTETNLETHLGYGSDKYTESAIVKIRTACNKPFADVQFLIGGTQTNQIVISTVLQSYEGVVAAKTGHVSVHEAGAIEYSGHKVLEIEGHEGKICADQLKKYLDDFFADLNCDHMVFPGMVYISYPTEYGTLYSRQELSDIYEICNGRNIPLYIDGARLAYGLCSRQCDITLEELASLCDIFYIGGTKAGALCGEAVVFSNMKAPKHFLTQVKQRGALLAKGRLLGIQFDALFTDDLYMRIGRHAIDMAEKLKDIFVKKGYTLLNESPTNQQFVVIDNDQLAELGKNVECSFWEKYDDNKSVVRFATSWSTTKEDLEELEKYL